MRRFCATFAVIALLSAPVLADVTVTTAFTMEGGAAGMMPAGSMPRMVMRIKGDKARTDIEAAGQTTTSIVDLALKQMILLEGASKTARIVDSTTKAPGAPDVTLPKIESSTRPTGRTREIDGITCDEHAFEMTMDMSSTSPGRQVPPEAAAMTRDIQFVTTGSMWMAKDGPGMAEYLAFQKATLAANLPALAASAVPGLRNSGFDKLMATAAQITGLPYLTEMAMTVEGTGELVEMMKQMASMKVTMKVTSISTDALSADLFRVPAGYTVGK